MKQTFFIFLALCFGPVLSAQSIDSLATLQVDSLIRISRDLTVKRDYGKALELNEAAMKIAVDVFGKESDSYGACCYNHGRINHFSRDLQSAEKWYLESKMIREKTLGKDHPDYAWSLHNLAILYNQMDQYLLAEQYFLESKSIREKTLGKEHPDYISSLNSTALMYWKSGKFEMAESLYLESKTIVEKTAGKYHPDYAQCLENLALTYQKKGQMSKSEALLLESLAIRKKGQGSIHPSYGRCLWYLANLYNEQTEYEKAEPLYLENLIILEKTIGKNHPDYGGSLNDLANLYGRMGQFEKAEPLYLESVSLREKLLGKENAEYAKSVGNLALMYSFMGLFEKAESLFLESVHIREKVLGKDHPDYAGTLNNLANLYCRMGQFEKAEPLLLESKEIREKTFGKSHPDYAISLQGLASLYNRTGQYDLAESLYKESIAIFQLSLGHEHPEYAIGLNNLAILYDQSGQLEKAEGLYQESKTIREKTLGRNHIEYAISLGNLGKLYLRSGKYDLAENYFIEQSSVYLSLLKGALNHLSEQELNLYLNTFSTIQDLLLSVTHTNHSGKTIPTCYDNSLFYKGFLLQAAGRIRQIAQMDQSSSDLFNQLKGYQRRLAAQYTRPILERDSTLVIQLETQVNDLEKELTRTVAGYGEAMQQVSWNEVQQVLQPGEAAVEFVHFRSPAKDQEDSIHYAALVLLPGREKPIFISLFEEQELMSLLQIQDQQSKYIPYASRGLKPEQNPNFAYLYELVWKPLEVSLHGVKKVWFSASGMLHRINLAAIPLDNGAILSDRFDLVALSSTRQLVVPNHDMPLASSAVLIGGVQFDLDSTLLSTPDENLFGKRSISTAWSESGTRQGTWSPLAWTAREVESITTTLFSGGFQTITYTSTGATEEVVKAIGMESPSPRVLHLATHGFFFPDPDSNSEKPGMDEKVPVFKLSDNAMVRSGLILAGGNYAWQHGHAPKPDMEDGILTAYEISQMNLSNTELVVLSACETGLGDIQGNEGVYGLQRAFKIAGAKYLIMSLWQVPDLETMEFMTTFYRHWLEEQHSIPDAFRKTQRELRDRFFNPYSWAGFVLVE